MGEATVVLAGDFQQTLPIVTRGTPADQINACLKNSYLWHHDWLSHRAILSSRNDVVEKFNATIQKQLPGQEYAYKSIDCILNDDEAVQYSIEFLNSIQTSDLQAHNLILKAGAPVILIRNIDAPSLYYGTRLIVKNLMQHVIQATVLTGCAKGEDVFIQEYQSIPQTTPYNSR
ncbi:ATP-dependent DNA helicase [Trichonephila inaurata madagascariensis]|uniref:ATP-dependent DNA helicase n=1 Tax=Trichonephila inaurata madagascariensis TaxID=2747483 RepID=A0A8X6XM42_9ARAC|nr:ATP-dependent DNA helicase [Trichonephila inaurata madagascariensis]